MILRLPRRSLLQVPALSGITPEGSKRYSQRSWEASVLRAGAVCFYGLCLMLLLCPPQSPLSPILDCCQTALLVLSDLLLSVYCVCLTSQRLAPDTAGAQQILECNASNKQDPKGKSLDVVLN